MLPLSCTQIEISPAAGLELLEAKVRKELLMLNIPSKPWIQQTQSGNSQETLDVAIIGGGMGGLAAAFALIREGITDIQIFDENPEGFEGPWNTYARMNVLRSGKTCLGPALGVPSLTFWAWYEAQYDGWAWEAMKSVPTSLWHAYLSWFRRVLRLPIENNMTLMDLIPLENGFQLNFLRGDDVKRVKARKVILATGRKGAGGVEIPKFMGKASKKLYAHTGEHIDPISYRDKKIVIIGAGASAFDAAATALESGGKSVEMIVRRPAVPSINKMNQLYYPGAAQGFYSLPDEDRFAYFAEALEYGTPPPKEALERVKGYANFHVRCGVEIYRIDDNGDMATLFTNKGTIETDFIILATGYCIDLSRRVELKNIYEQILLWKDRLPENVGNIRLGKFPYLGPHFEFLEAKMGAAPYLKNIYCFNYGAFLSHGMLAGDISLISLGANRLVEGIVIDFFINEKELYLEKFKKYRVSSFKTSEYEYIKKIY